MKTRLLAPTIVIALLLIIVARGATAASVMTIERGDHGQYHIKHAGHLVTTLHTEGFPKPILYPIVGPHGIRMTRDYPMKEGTAGEAKDHPHHQSLWFTHGDVNGISFWHIGDDAGRIVTKEVKTQEQGTRAVIELEDKWVGPKNETICTDHQKITVHKPEVKGGQESFAIDYEVTVHASEGDLVFGDTKEGTMGIRTHPRLRIDKGAAAVNSEGESGGKIWGKRAKWVDYSNEIDGHTVGVAIFDHPGNPGFPTWWHARDYGLIAANPFGVSDFEKKPRGTGNLKVPEGKSVTFRYRFLFHTGNAEAAHLGDLYQAFAK